MLQPRRRTLNFAASITPDAYDVNAVLNNADSYLM